MKASELRVGNLIESGMITRMDIGDTLYSMEVTKNGKRRNISNPAGELLTEDWLLRFGFEKDLVCEDWSIKKVFPNLTNPEVGDNTFFIFLNEGYSTYGKYKFQYVHQLQNLYFALTGEELILKP